jgi:UDPglucose 6-dehydrogenase
MEDIRQQMGTKVTVAVVGLGKLGAPMVACFADKGHRVIGVDIDPDRVKLIDEGKAPVFEPQLDEILRANSHRVSATQSYEAAVMEAEITFIIVPTPSDGQGGFSLEFVLEAVAGIGDVLRNKNEWHLVVVTSTVLPGSMQSEVLPALERHSGKKCSSDFGLCYNPEFIALGSVIYNVYNPDFVLVGESDARSGDILEEFYGSVVENSAPVARMNFVNAELTKISVNTFVTTKISYANMLAEVCERIPSCDVDVVTSAIGLDSRIGGKYLKGALGYGGPCFPRDNAAFAHMARNAGVEPTLAVATDTVNRRQPLRLLSFVLSKLPSNGKVSILGLSYKPDTNVIEGSQGLELARLLISRDVPVVLYDPAAMDAAREALGNCAIFASSPAECLELGDLIIIATPWRGFRAIQPAQLASKGKRPILLDCWRILDGQIFADVADYVTIGRGV